MALPASGARKELLREEPAKRVEVDAALRKLAAVTGGSRPCLGAAGRCTAGERAQLRRADEAVVADIAYDIICMAPSTDVVGCVSSCEPELRAPRRLVRYRS